MKGTVFQIQRFCVHDGPGIRTTVFFKGCPLQCRWCHNPEGQRSAAELAYREDRCLLCAACVQACPADVHCVDAQTRTHAVSRALCVHCGLCVECCPAGAVHTIGRDMTADEVVACALRDKAFYGSTGGITCSGGECTLQPDFLLQVLRLSRENGLNTAVETCGMAARHVFEAIMPYTDTFLYDIKAISASMYRQWIGTEDGGEILNNYRLLPHAAVEVRVPLIPGVNDTGEEIAKIGAFLLDAGIPRCVKVLPYHTPGRGKYAQLGRAVWLPEKAYALTPEDAQRLLDDMLY